MAHRQSRNASPSRRGRKPGAGNKNKTPFIIIAIIAAVVIVGLITWLCWPKPTTGRAALDKYVELSHTQNTKKLLGDGASVYVDMSDGMISAYAAEQAKKDLQAVINKLAADDAIKFYELAAGEITELNKTHTQLYNYVLDEKSYKRDQAPIEKTLEKIVEKNQPALLMTDFEEYNNGRIHQAAYAKKYFIEWLEKGNNITFYKWDFVEGTKNKHMFFAVFDDNANRLNGLVSDAVKTIDPSIETYVLAGREFAYPTATNYLSFKQGGNYHNSKGVDVVTNVLEDESAEAYVSYAKPYASSTGAPGHFAPLDLRLGEYAEYYPLGVSWEDAVRNAADFQEEGVPDEEKYQHLLSDLYINFDAQSGYSIDDIEVRVFDVNDAIAYVGENEAIDESISTPEINGFLTAGKESGRGITDGWSQIFVDFDAKFNGTFPATSDPAHFFRANIVLSKASAKLNEADSFFGWEGNPSLANSVRETLQAATSNPAGRVLYTYYFKTL